MKRFAALLIVFVSCVYGQSNYGELRLLVTDPSGLSVQTKVEIVSEGNQYSRTLATDEHGALTVKHLPYGVYSVEIHASGFAGISEPVDIASSIPIAKTIQLAIQSVSQSVTVSAANTLIDPDQAGEVSQIGTMTIQRSPASLPGRSLQDLVNSQPGWLYEGNAVLHPRGSEYQTQFVVDGIPLQDNRSPSFGPALDANDVQSMSIYTSGFPAEYGRKMGGVIEVNTVPDTKAGFHGQAVLSGGSFDTAGSYLQGQYGWGKNAFSASASGDMTGHYLNPVVPQNYNNTGTTGEFSAEYERQFTRSDTLSVSIRHELSRYDIPNEQVQQAAGQRQTADNFETIGMVSYQHIFSPHAVADFRGMVRDNSNDFYSNADSTPIIVLQHNSFREGYFKAAVTLDHGLHEWKVGVESDNSFLHENFGYTITDPSRFDEGTPNVFNFAGHRPDIEQSGFVQDLIRAGKWTINAGIRWDHYQLLLNRQAVDPRLSVSRFFPTAGLVAHFSYDRVFQTPSSANILLSSSSNIVTLNPETFLQLPVEPSEGNYYEAGLTKSFFGKFKLDANYYRRMVGNTADDDQIANTTISFPIAFSKSVIYGAEGKIDVPQWGRFSGFLSYSYQVGNVWFPVTGGPFLGDNASAAESQLSGHFPDSQDQRNTVRGHVRYQAAPRLWIAGGIEYNSGLPFEFDGDPATVLAQYGQQVLDRINFGRGRIDPAFLVDASIGADIYKSDRLKMQLQLDGENLTNLLDVIDFGGLFSGNALGPSRSYSVRLTTTF